MLILIMPLFSVPHVKAQKTYLADLSKWDSVFRIPSFTVPTASITSRSNTDLFQFNITLSRLVAISSISIAIETSNLAFYYQPPLNQELVGKEYEGWKINETHAIDDKGFLRNYRPLNVVGSYAVYSTTKWGNQYKTGKLFHIYRPLLIDAKGKTSWATLNITKTALTITLPQAFLASATYPVTVDPTFGYTSLGASTSRNPGDYINGGLPLSQPSAGTVDNIIVALKADGAVTNNAKCGIYKHVDSSFLTNGATDQFALDLTTSFQWFTLTYTSKPSLVVSTDYVISVWVDHTGIDNFIAIDSGYTGYMHQRAQGYTGTFPNPITWTDTYNYIVSIYATYMVSGQDLTFQLSETAHLTSSLYMGKEKGYSLSEIAHLTSAFVKQKELGFPLSATVKVTDSLTMNKEIAIVIHEWLYGLQETAYLTSNLYATLEIEEKVSLGIGFYIGVLALVIALMAYLRSRH